MSEENIKVPAMKTWDTPGIYSALMKICIYYGSVAIILLVVANIAPVFFNSLPFGGVAELSGSAVTEYGYEDKLLGGDTDDIRAPEAAPTIDLSRFDDARTLLFAMFGALIIMIPVALVYRTIHTGGEHDHSLDETAMVLPSVVAGIVLIVQHSLALAFSLAGIVAGVQFRRALTDTFDTLFIFVAIGVGIAAGIKALDVGFVMAVFFCITSLVVCLNSDGLESHFQLQRRTEKAELKERMLAAETKSPARETPNDPAN